MAVVRLKRRYDQNPVDSFLFASKRFKAEEGDNTIDPTLFKFAATVASKEQDCSASACVNKVLQSEHLNPSTTSSPDGKARKSLTAKNKRKSDITEKLRKENQLHSENSRYEVVKLFRNIKPEDCTEDGTITPLTVIDIVNQEKSEEEIKESEYVYDLYYTHMGSDVDELIAGNTYSILPIQDELYLGGDSNEDSDLEPPEDDEDSNEENNFRNEYPEDDEVQDDVDEYKSEEDYEGDICEYGEDPDVSGMANDFIGQCRLADSEDDMYSSDDGDLSSDDGEDKIYDEDLVVSHSSYATYIKKKLKRDGYRNDIDDEDEFS